MASNSRHHLDAYVWIIRVTNSCTEPVHLEGVSRLINRFPRQYPEAPIHLHDNLWDEHTRRSEELEKIL